MKLKDMFEDKKTGKRLFEAGILIMVINLLCVVGIWQSILNGWKVIGDGELFFQAFIRSGGKYLITYLNQESIYISFLSVLFSFLGNKEELVAIINLILQLSGIGFFYLGAKKLFRFIFPLAIVVICGILSGCFYNVNVDYSMHIIWFLSGLAFWIIAKVFCDFNGLYRKHILLGILLGIFYYVDFAGIFFLILCVLLTFLIKEDNFKEKGMQLLCLGLSSFGGFFCMLLLWNDFLQQWFTDKIKYFKPETGLNQYISLIVVLIVCTVFYVIKNSRNTESSSEELNPVFRQITEQENSGTSTVNEGNNTVLISTSAEQDIEIEIEPATESTADESKFEDVGTEVKKPIRFLENPLPVPKKHVRKEMNYAFEPSPDQMHYDLNNYRLDDDYDLKD